MKVLCFFNDYLFQACTSLSLLLFLLLLVVALFCVRGGYLSRNRELRVTHTHILGPNSDNSL